MQQAAVAEEDFDGEELCAARVKSLRRIFKAKFDCVMTHAAHPNALCCTVYVTVGVRLHRFDSSPPNRPVVSQAADVDALVQVHPCTIPPPPVTGEFDLPDMLHIAHSSCCCCYYSLLLLLPLPLLPACPCCPSSSSCPSAHSCSSFALRELSSHGTKSSAPRPASHSPPRLPCPRQQVRPECRDRVHRPLTDSPIILKGSLDLTCSLQSSNTIPVKHFLAYSVGK